MLRTSVESIDSAKSTVSLSTGKALPYDILVMATGADAVRPGIPGEDLEGVFPLRHLADGLKVKDYLDGARCKKAVIIGGGFIAMEMAEAFRNLHMDVKIMDILPAPVARWSGELSQYILEELQKNRSSFSRKRGRYQSRQVPTAALRSKPAGATLMPISCLWP